MNTISFSIQEQHTVTTGEAIIVDSFANGVVTAGESFEGRFNTRNIGVISDGVRHDAERYTIYENYQDSASDEYVYFAIKNEE